MCATGTAKRWSGKYGPIWRIVVSAAWDGKGAGRQSAGKDRTSSGAGSDFRVASPASSTGAGEGRGLGRKMRVDTTVVETNIHYPTDDSLLEDGRAY